MSLNGENNDDNDGYFKVRRVDASIKQELQPRRSDQDPGESESGRKENDDDGEHLLKEELAQMDWVRWDEEERLPEGWSYRWHKQRSIKAKSGFKRSLFFITDAGTKLKSSNEAFKYLVENDFPELDQEKMREFVQSWKNTERRNSEVEVKKEKVVQADFEAGVQEAEKEYGTEDEREEEEAPKKLTEEEKKEERRARDREGQRRRRALAKERRTEIKVEEDLDISEQSGLEEKVESVEGKDEEKHLEEMQDAGTGLRESKYEEDPMLPAGWKKATYFLQKNGRALPRFKAPDGTMFGSRAKVGFLNLSGEKYSLAKLESIFHR